MWTTNWHLQPGRQTSHSFPSPIQVFLISPLVSRALQILNSLCSTQERYLCPGVHFGKTVEIFFLFFKVGEPPFSKISHFRCNTLVKIVLHLYSDLSLENERHFYICFHIHLCDISGGDREITPAHRIMNDTNNSMAPCRDHPSVSFSKCWQTDSKWLRKQLPLPKVVSTWPAFIIRFRT